MKKNNVIQFSFLAYQKTFIMMGWASYLTPLATSVWFLLVNSLADLLEGTEIQDIEDGRFYYDFGFGNETTAKEFGTTKKTLSKALHELERFSLIEINSGNKGAGVSRLYFPLQVPKPEEIRIPKHFRNHYEDPEGALKRRINFLDNMLNPKKRIDYGKEDIKDYKLNINDNQQTKRLKVQAQYLILLAKHNVDTNNIELQSKERGKITKLITRFENPFLIEKVILRIYNEYENELTNVYGALVAELYKERPNEKNKTKKYKQEIQNKIKENEEKYKEVNEEFINNISVIHNITSNNKIKTTTHKTKQEEDKKLNSLFGF